MQKQALPVVTRSTGTTTAERYLAKLCDRSFLSLWSYPSVFRDQGKRKNGDGKEVCDLLVVFGNDIIIFSDKSCAFPDTGNTRLDWSRWFKRAVFKSAEQTWGAERWIREHPQRLFLDRACTQPFPLDLLNAAAMRFHHVVVAHNVSERCRRHFGGSGTLVFNSDVEARAQCDPDRCEPFHIGWLDLRRPFVHVLDDESLALVLQSRDTITDFVRYLSAKADLLSRFRDRRARMFITGEEELLAHYVTTLQDGQHAFDIPDGFDAVMIPEGDWADFLSSEARRSQVAADQISYCWDALIEKFSENILGGTSYFTTHPRIGDRERILRFLAREPRVRRRMLADTLIGLIEMAEPRQRASRVVLPSNPGDPHYCFLLLPRLPDVSDEEYRETRLRLLEAYCYVTKLVFKAAEDVVAIATETNVLSETRSEDALYFDARNWTPEMEAHAQSLQNDLGLLTKVTKFQDRVLEYPAVKRRNGPTLSPNPRNKPCPCGSGKKYKKCCAP